MGIWRQNGGFYVFMSYVYLIITSEYFTTFYYYVSISAASLFYSLFSYRTSKWWIWDDKMHMCLYLSSYRMPRLRSQMYFSACHLRKDFLAVLRYTNALDLSSLLRMDLCFNGEMENRASWRRLLFFQSDSVAVKFVYILTIWSKWFFSPLLT